MRRALFFQMDGDNVICNLCPHRCLIGEGKTGLCRQRRNEDGVLVAEGYGNVSSIALDPIEKKPLYHFYPGSQILSIGGLWCNLNCKFCQNWHIAHEEQFTKYTRPEDIVERAVELDSIGIAYTYNEPIIWYEYIYDTAKLARERGLKNVLITNGFINREPLEGILPYIDAMNIDVKAFNDDFYRKVCAGSLSPVKDAVAISSSVCHVEITTLIIGGLNDSPNEIEALAKWISRIDDNIPLHLSRYYPNYKLDIATTPRETMLNLRSIVKEYLPFVYIGNLMDVDNNTYCRGCGNLLIERGFHTVIKGIKDARCNSCGTQIEIF